MQSQRFELLEMQSQLFELLEMQFEIIMVMIYVYILDCNSLYLFQGDIGEV